MTAVWSGTVHLLFFFPASTTCAELRLVLEARLRLRGLDDGDDVRRPRPDHGGLVRRVQGRRPEDGLGAGRVPGRGGALGPPLARRRATGARRELTITSLLLNY